MATKKNQVEVKGLITTDFGKSVKQEAKTLFGACRLFWTMLQERDSKASKEVMQVIKSATKAKYNDEKKDNIVKTLVELCRMSAKYQTNEMMCTPFEKKYTTSDNGVTTSISLFKGFKVKDSFSIAFVIECWNRYLQETPFVDVKDKFYTNDEILVKYVEICKERGYDVSENTMLAYDAIIEEREQIAEAV
jgi:hypothetical protein